MLLVSSPALQVYCLVQRSNYVVRAVSLNPKAIRLEAEENESSRPNNTARSVLFVAT